MGATVQLFGGKNATGSMLTASTKPGGRYAQITHDMIESAGLASAISSARLFPPASGAVGLILFADQNVVNLPIDMALFQENFQGWFAEFISNSPADNKTWLSDLSMWAVSPSASGPTFDNITWSALVVVTQKAPETRISARNAIVSKWNQVLSAQLPSDYVTQNGSPDIWWHAFPVGWDYLSPKSIYIRLRQNLTVSVPVWGDYAAIVQYWIHLHHMNGAPLGEIARASYWVEGGVKSGDIAGYMDTAVLQDGVQQMNAMLPSVLAKVPKPVTDIYYLPGPAPTPAVLNAGERSLVGNSSDNDVTVVFQH